MVEFPARHFETNSDTRKRVSAAVPHGRDNRRGVRLNSRVPIELEWDSGGETRHGEAHTRVIGQYGCLVVTPQDLEVDQRVQLTNLVSSQSNPGVVVYRGGKRPDGWELGIELINPEMSFWGLDL